jgi:hypothetical protein
MTKDEGRESRRWIREEGKRGGGEEGSNRS